jgi:hypothetical protein
MSCKAPAAQEAVAFSLAAANTCHRHSMMYQLSAAVVMNLLCAVARSPLMKCWTGPSSAAAAAARQRLFLPAATR